MFVKDLLSTYKTQPFPPPGSYDGQVVCVVGSTTGLGFAAALHCLNLGAAEVIITSRDAGRGEAAKKRLEAAAAAATTTHKDGSKITLMQLDLNRYDSVVEFSEKLKRVRAGAGGVDYIIFNAAVIQSGLIQSPEGWQEELQVNAISTVLLALLLMPWLRAERKNRTSPAHLVFVTSAEVTRFDTRKWVDWAEDEGVWNHWNKKQNWLPGLSGGYAVSKSLAMYAIRELIKLAIGSDGRPWLIINTTCTGMVRTEIQRNIVADSRFLRSLEPILMPIFFKTPENGSKILVMAGLTKEEEHGRFLSYHRSNEAFQTNVIFATDAGRNLQRIVWRELMALLTAAVPAVEAARADLQIQT